jgi:VTC domain
MTVELETKYLLSRAQTEAARAILRARYPADRPHAGGTVESLYFDTPTLAAHDEKRASDFRKAKLRLRWYDGSGSVWAEVKQRVGGRRTKHRIVVAIDGERLSRFGLGCPELERLPDELAALAPFSELLPLRLSPIAHLRYRRDRFAEPGGARISIDSAIETVAVDLGRARPARLGPWPWIVIEIKGARREPSAGLGSLAALGARRWSFSKYGLCLMPHIS